MANHINVVFTTCFCRVQVENQLMQIWHFFWSSSLNVCKFYVDIWTKYVHKCKKKRRKIRPYAVYRIIKITQRCSNTDSVDTVQWDGWLAGGCQESGSGKVEGVSRRVLWWLNHTVLQRVISQTRGGSLGLHPTIMFALYGWQLEVGELLFSFTSFF